MIFPLVFAALVAVYLVFLFLGQKKRHEIERKLARAEWMVALWEIERDRAPRR